MAKNPKLNPVTTPGNDFILFLKDNFQQTGKSLKKAAKKTAGNSAEILKAAEESIHIKEPAIETIKKPKNLNFVLKLIPDDLRVYDFDIDEEKAAAWRNEYLKVKNSLASEIQAKRGKRGRKIEIGDIIKNLREIKESQLFFYKNHWPVRLAYYVLAAVIASVIIGMNPRLSSGTLRVFDKAYLSVFRIMENDNRITLSQSERSEFIKLHSNELKIMENDVNIRVGVFENGKVAGVFEGFDEENGCGDCGKLTIRDETKEFFKRLADKQRDLSISLGNRLKEWLNRQ